MSTVVSVNPEMNEDSRVCDARPNNRPEFTFGLIFEEHATARTQDSFKWWALSPEDGSRRT